MRLVQNIGQVRKGKRYIEKYVRGEGEILKNVVHQEVALIFSEFEAKRGRSQALSIVEEKARREATRSTFEWLLANASSGPNDLSAVLPSNEGDGGQPIKRIKDVLRSINEAVPEVQFDRISDAITDGDFDALVLFRKGFKPSPVGPKSGVKLEKTIEAYMDYMAHDENASWTRQTTAQYRSTMRLFSDYVGPNVEFQSIGPDSATGFLDKISHLHPHWGKHAGVKDLSFDDLLKKYPGKLTNKTINRHHIALRGLFQWGIDRKYYRKEEGNPFAFKLRKKGNRTKLPFTIEMLNALLEQPIVQPQQHSWSSARPWLTLIALFTGMREDEIGSLTVKDITVVDEIEFFMVSDLQEPGWNKTRTDT